MILISTLLLSMLFVCVATAQIGSRSPRFWGFQITHTRWEFSELEAATYTTHNKHKRGTSVSSAGFEPAIPTIKRLQGQHLKPLGHRDRPRNGLPARSGETTFVLRTVHPPHDSPS
jgi:hypothetical protein